MTNEEYKKYTKKHAPSSPVIANSIKAFLVGGTICGFGQILLYVYSAAGLEKTLASTLVSVTLIFLSVLLTALNVYDDIAGIGGAGTLVPITGFANAVTSPAIDCKAEGYVLGIGAKLFTIAGPVILYGTLSSVVYGVIIVVLKMLKGGM